MAMAGWLAVLTLLAVAMPVVLDLKQGERLRWKDLLCVLLAPYYLMLYTFVAVSAIFDEFVWERPSVFIRTEKTGNFAME
jgi:hypothetical protein